MLQPQNWLSRRELALFQWKMMGLKADAMQSMREAAQFAANQGFNLPADWVSATSTDSLQPAKLWFDFA